MTDEELAAIEARNATRREKVEGGEGCGCCRDEAADALPDIDTLIAEVRRLKRELEESEDRANEICRNC